MPASHGHALGGRRGGESQGCSPSPPEPGKESSWGEKFPSLVFPASCPELAQPKAMPFPTPKLKNSPYSRPCLASPPRPPQHPKPSG